jgi:SET domain-containing protein
MPRKIAARKSQIHGNGVFALLPIARGERIVEYKGKRRTHADVDAGDSGDADSGHTFLFTLNDDYVIDANFAGNTARWINHSCRPNCEAVLEENEKDPRKSKVFIEARRAIKPGDELTYDYGITLDEPHTARLKKIWACRCGAPNCSGTMLKPKVAAKKPAKPASRGAGKTPKKRRAA